MYGDAGRKRLQRHPVPEDELILRECLKPLNDELALLLPLTKPGIKIRYFLPVRDRDRLR